MSDPTAIPIQSGVALDPLRTTMRGVTAHGGHPFEIPFITPVAFNLFQGGCKDGMILPEEIVHVVSLYPWEAYRMHQNVRTMVQVTMYDSLDTPVNHDQMFAIAAWVNWCRSDAPTLVHCQAGLNRSSLVVAAAMVLGGMSGPEAVAHLRSSRCDAVLCNGVFEEWVMSL